MAIGKIEIDILANTSKLVKSMNKTEKTFQKSMSNMTKAAVGFATIFVSGQLISKITATNAALDKIGKTSSKLGITAEALQGLHLAAEEAGISTETLDMAIQRMTRRVAEAAMGTGEAVGALNELNITAAELAKLTPDEMLKRVADGMLNVTSQSDKVRLSMKLFDSEGVALVNMLSKGSKGLDDVADKAERLGLIIGGNYIKAIERSNDTWNISNQIIGTAWKGISVGMAGSLEGLMTKLNNSSKSVNIFAETMNMTRQIIYYVARGLQITAATLSATAAGYKVAHAALKAFNGDANRPEKPAQMMAYYEAVIVAEAATKTLNEAITNTGETSVILSGLLNNAFAGLNMDEILKKINSTNDAVNEGTDLWKLIGKEAAIYYKNVSNKTTKAKAIISAMNTTISSGLTGAFRQAMDGATNFGDVFEGILKDVVAQLIQTLFITKAVAAALSFGGGSPAAAGGGGDIAVGGAMADGGIVKSGSSFLVGENGAEIVTLPKGANVTPHGAAPMGGGTNVSVNVINNAGVDVGVEQDGDNIEIVISAITNQLARGTGNIGKTLEARYGLKKS